MTRRLLCVAGVLLGFSAPAFSDDGDEARIADARVRFERAEKLFAVGRFEEALTGYQEAYEQHAVPDILFNIGQCHRNLKRWDAAIFSFRKFLRLKPDAENRAAVETLIEMLEGERERERLRPGHVSVGPDAALDPRPLPPPPSPSRPFYKKWWFWAGTAAVTAGAAVLAVGLGDNGPPASDLGNIDFPR